ncbi:MAG: MMPL family transporter [Actinomycetales bacterium]|nr:MAG: MMPL family transporter [Actinomycetales bacterium]
MFEKLGHVLVRRRKTVLAGFIVTTIAAGVVGSLVFARLDGGGYSDPGSDSSKAVTYLTDTFKVKDPAIIFIIDAGKNVADPAVAAEVAPIEADLRSMPEIAKTLSYWSAGGAKQLISEDGKAAYLFIYGHDADSTLLSGLASNLQKKYDGKIGNLRIYVGGFSTFNAEINKKISSDLKFAEAISIPLTFLFLLFVFGGLIASAMPVIVAVSAILGAFLILYLISLVTGVSIFALNLVTGLGMGLGIDYSLLMVNRFREELHAGKSVEESVAQTVKTAGKTVFFSGITVMISLASLMFFPQMFLKSFGYAGVSVVAVAILGALIPLPAILALLGTKIDKFVVRKSAITPKEDGRWAHTARFVMRRPVSVVVLSLLILGTLAAPLKDIVFSQVDTRVLPASNKAALAAKVGLDKFPGQQGNPIEIIIPNGTTNMVAINNFVSSLANVPGVVAVGAPETAGNDIRIAAIHSMSARTPTAEKMITEIRNLKVPEGTLVGGVAADYADSQIGIAKKLPLALLWIAIGTLLLLFMFTGSIILPIKAVILNLVSLSATMGVLTWVFIGGHFTWLVGSFTNTGTIDTSIGILIAVVAFGLSMDYEVFLLSRIKEEHDAGHSNIESVAIGLQRSARIITAAAVILSVVFAIFVTSGVTSIKTMGFGVAFAILLDATLIRALLVPALMRLFGERNWWAPKALKRFTISH